MTTDTPGLSLVGYPHGSRQTGPIDQAAAERASRQLLVALGADLTDETVRDTPRRMAAAYVELLTPSAFEPTTFPNREGYDELVVGHSIPFHSPASITCFRSSESLTSATCPTSASWVFRNSPVSWTCPLAISRCRND